MDELFSSYAVYFAIFWASLGVLYFIFKHRRIKAVDGSTKLPPGSTGWPIIGETIQFGLAGRRGTPEKFINDRTSKYSSDNLFRTSLIGENQAVFCGAAGNKCLFSKENKYVRTWLPPSVKNFFGDTNTVEVRGFIVPFAKPEALQRSVPIMDSMAKHHLETHWFPFDSGVIKVGPVVKKYTLAVSCRVFMSIEDSEWVKQLEDPYKLLSAGIVSLPINFPGTAFNTAIKGVKTIRKQLGELIKQRRQEMMDNSSSSSSSVKDDLLSRLLVNVGTGEIENENVISDIIIGLLAASHDTTSASITMVINFLAQFPDVYDRVLKEQMEIAKSKKGPNETLVWEDMQKMSYSWMVACEAMRLWPPSAGTFREVIQDFTFSGYTIPKGWKAHWSVFSTHRNPKYFPDPDRFDPSRFEGNGPAPYTYVPYGGGPRMCPGKEFGKVEILIFMHNLVTNFSFKKAIPDEKIIFTHCPEPVNGLPIFIQRHNSLPTAI